MEKQEQKKILIEMMQEDEELGLYDEPKQQEEFCHYSGLPSPTAYVEEPKLGNTINKDELGIPKGVLTGLIGVNKQETLEEVAERYYNNFDKRKEEFAFIDGAKWQQERMYSEEEVIELLISCKDRLSGFGLVNYVEDSNVIKWFKLFKKK